jgi:fused signal recognition particle receptor
MLEGLRKAFQTLTERLSTTHLGEKEVVAVLEEFKLQLVSSDVSLSAADSITAQLRDRLGEAKLPRFGEREGILKALYKDILSEALLEASPEELLNYISRRDVSSERPYVILFVGPNGGGKTTTLAKIAFWFKRRGIRPVIACSDTFRAAAIEQVKKLAAEAEVRAVSQRYGADPAAVAVDAIQSAAANKEQIVLIDTAGRSETKRNLLDEMQKIKRVTMADSVFLVLDSLTGSVGQEQARIFHESVNIDYVILTKLDSDTRGGLALTVCHEIKRPILFLGVGQGLDDLIPFKKDFLINRVLS